MGGRSFNYWAKRGGGGYRDDVASMAMPIIHAQFNTYQ